MKLKKIMVFTLLYLFGICIPILAANQDIIFIVDLSKSMNQQNLFNKVRASLKDYIQQSEIGDRIIILGFGEDVTILADEDIRKVEDLTNIMKKIDAFEAAEDWTYMTKALDLAARNIKDLQEAYPRRSKLIYLLTDGKNDPPPNLKEPPINFEDIINKYFEVYTKEGTYTYIVTYGVSPEEGLKKLADKIKVQISEKPPSPEKALPAQIILTPKYIYKEIELSDYIELPIEISIDRLYLAKGAELFFDLKPMDIPEDTEIGYTGQERFVCDSKDQKIYFTIWVRNLREEGSYRIELIPKTSDLSIMIIPSFITVSLKAKYKEKPMIIIQPSYIKLKQKIKEGYVSKEFILNFENKTSKLPILLLFSIEAEDMPGEIELSPEQIELKEGVSKSVFEIKCKNLEKGKYKFDLLATSLEKEVEIEPSRINLELNLYTQADLVRKTLIWLIPLIIILAAALFFIYCKFFMPKFKGMYLLSGGLEFDLEDYRPFCSRKVVLGKNLDFGFEEGAFAILKITKTMECVVIPYKEEKIIVNGREVENEVSLSQGSVVRYKNIEFTFQRKEE